MTGRARQKRRRESVILHLLDGQKPGLFAVRAGRDHSLVTDEDAAVRFRRPSLGVLANGQEVLVVEDASDEARGLRLAHRPLRSLSSGLSLRPAEGSARKVAEKLSGGNARDLRGFLQS